MYSDGYHRVQGEIFHEQWMYSDEYGWMVFKAPGLLIMAGYAKSCSNEYLELWKMYSSRSPHQNYNLLQLIANFNYLYALKRLQCFTIKGEEEYKYLLEGDFL